jgi:ribonuclease Z
MQITLLGTGSPIPDPRRAGPTTLVGAGGTALLVDCGRGVLMRLAGAGMLPPMLGAVLVTHLHSDHLTDLNDVITTHWVMNAEAVTLSVFGPPGMREVVDATLGALAPDIRYRLAHHADLTEPRVWRSPR